MSNNSCLLAAGKIRKFKSGQTVLTARIVQGAGFESSRSITLRPKRSLNQHSKPASTRIGPKNKKPPWVAGAQGGFFFE